MNPINCTQKKFTMANVSESQLVTRLGEILHSCDHDTTTTNSICRLLEAEFPPEFINSRKELIRQQIELFVDVLVVEQEVKEDSQNEVVLEEEREGQENKQVEDPQRRKRRKSHGQEITPKGKAKQKIQKERGHKQLKKLDDPEKKEKVERPTASNITAPLPLSDALIEFFGTGQRELSRAQAIKKIWEYIKENKLQDPSDRKLVLCDEKLKELFKVDSFGFSTVSKLLTPHLIKSKN